MALMDFIKKQFIDILQWTEDGDGTLAWRFPMEGMEIQNGGTLVVRESQMAVFVNEGQVADVFGPGTYKLTTQTLPVLTYLKNWDKLFQSPFKSDVYFFSTRQQIDQKWGTPQPITIRDKDFGAVRLRAFGNYAYRIADPKLFHTEISGTRDSYPVGDLEGQLRGMVLQNISNAIAGSGLFPFSRADYEAVVKQGGKGSQASLRGFAKAFDIVNAAQGQADQIGQMLNLLSNSEHKTQHSRGLDADLAAQFPPQVHPLLTLGHERMLDYQGPAYARLYVQRLQQVLQAEQATDPSGAQGFAITIEMARWLALWMAFDDIVRVADLKSRASRWQRVQGEVKAQADDLLKVYDHFKPGAPEFAALLPPALAARVLAWDRRRTAAGNAPWALPLKVGSHSVGGMLALRALASLKWLRVRGSRYATEQTMIDRWLAGVVQGTQRHWALGHEVALCGRLIKGYGATNERGKDNLLHVLDHLAQGANAEQAASAVAAAREAALADDAGRALDATLVQHGAPARPVKAQPIRWMRPPRKA